MTKLLHWGVFCNLKKWYDWRDQYCVRQQKVDQNKKHFIDMITYQKILTEQVSKFKTKLSALF
jgi:hypothetical protein